MGAPRPSGSSSTRITSATTTSVKGTAGHVRRLVLEAAATGIITLNDGAGARLILPAAFPAGSYELDIYCPTKIEVVTAAADRVVVVFD